MKRSNLVSGRFVPVSLSGGGVSGVVRLLRRPLSAAAKQIRQLPFSLVRFLQVNRFPTT